MKPPVLLDAKTILDFQRLAGNQYVGKLIRKQSTQARIASAAIPEIVPEIMPEIVSEADAVQSLIAPPARARWAQMLKVGIIAFLIVVVCSIAVYAVLHWTLPTLPNAAAILIALASGAVMFLSIFYFVWRRASVARAN